MKRNIDEISKFDSCIKKGLTLELKYRLRLRLMSVCKTGVASCLPRYIRRIMILAQWGVPRGCGEVAGVFA